MPPQASPAHVPDCPAGAFLMERSLERAYTQKQALLLPQLTAKPSGYRKGNRSREQVCNGLGVQDPFQAPEPGQQQDDRHEAEPLAACLLYTSPSPRDRG